MTYRPRWRASAAAAGVPRHVIRREARNRGDYLSRAVPPEHFEARFTEAVPRTTDRQA